MLFEHAMRLAASRADWMAGSRMATSIAITAIDTRSSTRVKPDLEFMGRDIAKKPLVEAKVELAPRTGLLDEQMDLAGLFDVAGESKCVLAHVPDYSQLRLNVNRRKLFVF